MKKLIMACGVASGTAGPSSCGNSSSRKGNKGFGDSLSVAVSYTQLPAPDTGEHPRCRFFS